MLIRNIQIAPIFNRYITSSNFDGPITFKMSFENSTVSDRCSMTVLLRESAFPDMTSFGNNNVYDVCRFNSTESSSCEVSISYPLASTWHYLAVTSTCDYTVEVDSVIDCFATNTALVSQPIGLPVNTTAFIATSGNDGVCSKLLPPIETFRFIGPTYFSVKYYFNSNYNRSNSVLILNDQKPYFIEFLVDLSSNGGTLHFKLINNLILNPNYVSDETNQSNTSRNSDFNLTGVRSELKTCLLYNSMSRYKNCPIGYDQSTLSEYKKYSNLVLKVPYPMMGKWYLAIWKECYNMTTK